MATREMFRGDLQAVVIFLSLEKVGYSLHLLILLVITMRITNKNNLLLILNLLLAGIRVCGGGAF
ncbi:MAG: hypothetical protein WCH30_00915 [Chlorobiaceae bacterium]